MYKIITKTSLLIALFIFTLNISTAQEWKKPIDLGGDYLNDYLNSVFFIDANIGWAVGMSSDRMSGIIRKTTNGGNSWTDQTNGVFNPFLSVFFTNTNTGWVVGHGGVILKTNNGGNSWTEQTSGTAHELRSVYFIDDNNGWAVGGTTGDSNIILKTTNGGNTWSKQNSGTTPGTNTILLSIYFTDANNGWSVGDGGTIINTDNGGNSWTVQTSGTFNWLWSVYFTDVNNGWAVGNNGTIRRTINGGSTWQSQTSGTSNHLTSVYFTNEDTGWVLGAGGIIRKTTNKGIDWTAQGSKTSSYLSSVYFTDANTGWAVGSNGAKTKTTDGGNNWTLLTNGTSNHLHSVYFSDENTGWAVGDGGVILKTTNKGISWKSQISGTTSQLNSVYFTDANTGYVVGNNGTIRKTTNGGNSWITQTSGTTNSLRSVYFIDSDTGWAVGNGGIIRKTTNGGSSWISQTSGTTNSLTSVFFLNSNSGWIIGGSTLRRTSNGGNSWTTQSTGLSFNLQSVFYNDFFNGWVVGSLGTIRKTNGSGWFEQNSGTSAQLNSLFFIDADTGWVVGNEGVILNTTNGGSNWTSKTFGTSSNLNSVFFTDANNGWAVGNNGEILIYQGIKPIDSLLCNSFVMDGTLIEDRESSNVNISVPYKGGNGQTYNGQIINSTGVSGLTATLDVGSFAFGDSFVIYKITGTPIGNGIASFELNLGGHICTINLPIEKAITCPEGLGDSVILIPVLPFSSKGRSTCGAGNNLNNTNSISCGSFNAEEEVFIFSPDVSDTFNIKISGETNSSLILFEGCPLFGQGGVCINSEDSQIANKIILSYLDSGKTYYLVVSSFSSTSCINYDISINLRPRPSLTFIPDSLYNSNIGVYPESGRPNSTHPESVFEYRVRYAHPENLPPMPGYPVVGIDMNGNGTFDDVISLSEVDIYDQNYVDGKDYYFVIGFEPNSKLQYAFMAYDSIGNYALGQALELKSGPLVFVDSMDLYLYANDISFSDANPSINEQVEIKARVQNSSFFKANNVPVSFYHNNTLLQTQIIPEIEPGSFAELIITQSFATSGYYPIKVIIDEANTIQEENKLNNFAIRPLIIGNFSMAGSIIIDISSSTLNTCANSNFLFKGTATYSPEFGNNIKVSGAQVIVNIVGTEETFVGYTNINGNFSIPVSSPGNTGAFALSTKITDFTVQGQTSSHVCYVVDCPSNISIGKPTPFKYWNSIETINRSSNYRHRVFYKEYRADLAVYSHFISPSSINPDINDYIIISTSLENIGNIPADSFYVRFMVDQIQLGNPILVPRLFQGHSTSVQATDSFSAGVPGYHLIEVELDVTNNVPEFRILNNKASRAIVVGNTFDLSFIPEIGLYLSNEFPRKGEVITIYSAIENIGKVNAIGEIHYFSVKGNDTVFIDSVHFSINQMDTLYSSVNWTTTHIGGKILAQITGVQPMESNESNNMATVNIGKFDGEMVKPQFVEFSKNVVVCEGDSFTLFVEAKYTSEIQWYQNSNLINGATDTFYTITFANMSDSGEYMCIISNAYLSDTGKARVVVNPLPNAGFTANHNGMEISFVPDLTGLISYNWKFGDGDSSILESPVHSYLLENTYTVTLQTESVEGCVNSNSQNITVANSSIIQLNDNFDDIKAFPNPFSNTTLIEFTIHQSQFVKLQVYDVLGNNVVSLVQEDLQAGLHKVIFNGEGLSAGIYIYQLQIGKKINTGKIILK